MQLHLQTVDAEEELEALTALGHSSGPCHECLACDVLQGAEVLEPVQMETLLDFAAGWAFVGGAPSNLVKSVWQLNSLSRPTRHELGVDRGGV